ncbi:16S rRNA (guanine(527)-N(7))-methyltransferase RsmG [Falsirhodobacter algicola]|nr:16S rRNA (guanine(527)-N(7))-methyltransferase RsmG [Falsirhodobacter algicola]
MDRLEAYRDLVLKWNKSINLIGRGTEADIWERHIQDSLQLLDDAPSGEHWADLGSGGGFPGLVVAIATADLPEAPRITLVESDARKCVFLREVARQLDLNVIVQTSRIETLAPQNADIVSARALAGLDQLMGYAHRHLKPGGGCNFLKGAGWEQEVRDARTHWAFDCQHVPSHTRSDAVILKIRGLSRVE